MGLYWRDQARRAAKSPTVPSGPRPEVKDTRVLAGKADPYHGYYYTGSHRQGKDAPGGAYDYLVRGKMMAVSAWSLIRRSTDPPVS